MYPSSSLIITYTSQSFLVTLDGCSESSQTYYWNSQALSPKKKPFSFFSYVHSFGDSISLMALYNTYRLTTPKFITTARTSPLNYRLNYPTNCFLNRHLKCPKRKTPIFPPKAFLHLRETLFFSTKTLNYMPQ